MSRDAQPNQPKSLLQFAGAPLHPSPLAQAALIVIDGQLEYLNGKLVLPDVDAAVGELAALLDLARRSAMPVFHIVHHGRPGGALFDPEGPAVAIIPVLAPLAGEPVVTKGL